MPKPTPVIEDSGGSANRNDYYRSTRYEFPKFGGDGLESWLMRCEYFFEVVDVKPEDRVKVAAIHLEGRAMLWHRGFMSDKGELVCKHWEDYTKALAARFGTLAYADPMADIKNLRQVSSLHTYMNEFDDLYARYRIKEDQALSFFLAGLVDELQMLVHMFKPTSLADAYALAKLQEVTVRALGGKSKGSYVSQQSNNTYFSGIKALTVTTSPKPMVIGGGQGKPLTPPLGLA